MLFKVVVIDDELYSLKAIVRTFLWHQYNFEVVYETTNPREGLEYILKNHPDVVFTDVRMPGICGLELLNEVRNKYADIEFIIISGFDKFEYAQAALRGGAYDYYLKPVKQDSANKLLEKLSKYLADNRKNGLPEEEKPVSDNRTFNELLQYLQEHFQEKLVLNDLAKRFGFTSQYCCSLFQKVTGGTFSRYLTVVRMEKAKKYLLNRFVTIEEVAQLVGYHDYFYFNRAFKKYFGNTPARMKKNIWKATVPDATENEPQV